MRQWLVAAGIVEGPDGLLLVQNRRRNGGFDWSTPGGVVEEGETTTEGLTREVAEETGIVVDGWDGPLYSVEAVAEGLGWHLRVEVYRARSFSGELTIDDPDGIVVDARFVPVDGCAAHLDGSPLWVREPIEEWLVERWVDSRAFGYVLDGTDRATISIIRR